MTIILHDYFETPDGGGRLALLLARELEADLCYGFKSPDHPFANDLVPPHRHKRLCPGILPPSPVKQYLTARAFRKKTTFLQKYKDIFYSGAYAPLAVHNAPDCFNICYCHTPPRFVFDRKSHFLRLTPFWQRPAMGLYLKRFEKLYRRAMQSMDVIVANSENVRSRIATYLGLDAHIISPPVETSRFRWQGQEDFYLSTARLDPLKRVDAIIRAFKQLPQKKLVVVSGGSELHTLKNLAAGSPGITILGMVTEETLQKLLSTCIATIYVPEDEDFGMSPVESMAAGKPVIGVAQGGILETVIHGQTGTLISPEAFPPEIARAVMDLSGQKAERMRSNCEKRAAGFDLDIFIKRIKNVKKLKRERPKRK